jgi:hypothetical protein
MAARSRNILVDSFDSVSGDQGTSTDTAFGAVSSLASTLDELTRQAGELIVGGGQGGGAGLSRSPGTSPLYTVDVSGESGSRLNRTPTTAPVGQAPTTSNSNSALSIASTIFESGLGIVPLVSGLLGLFGGGSSTPPPLERYIMPDRLYFTGAEASGGIGSADYDQFGMPRLYGGMTTAMTTPINSGGRAPAATGTVNGASSQINVTVQAMDSQSFLDHSSEIAQAVRQAMLGLSSINDVVNDL